MSMGPNEIQMQVRHHFPEAVADAFGRSPAASVEQLAEILEAMFGGDDVLIADWLFNASVRLVDDPQRAVQVSQEPDVAQWLVEQTMAQL